MLSTVKEVIDTLGGTTEVAKMLGVGAPAVSNAKKAAKLPYRWHMKLYQEADKRGLRIAPDLIGLEGKG